MEHVFPSDETLDHIANGIFGVPYGSLVGTDQAAAVINLAIQMRISIQLERIADNLREV
jgi:hypothetical protein